MSRHLKNFSVKNIPSKLSIGREGRGIACCTVKLDWWADEEIENVIGSYLGRIAFDSLQCVLPIRQAIHDEVEDNTKDDKSSVYGETDRLVHS